jgi:NAD(P)-dependent dehydrogenase (short-subunit alcohol dehydrogenase family)
MSTFQFTSLEGKLVLVTGATSGIGKGVCNALLSQGARVIGIGRDRSKIDTETIENSKFTFLKLDLLEIGGIESVLKECVKEHGKLDGFVSSAGREETIPLNIYKTDIMKKLYDINVFSGVEILRFFSKKKNSNEGASAVFISSVMSELGQPGLVGYCGTKAALLGVVKSSALELSKKNIRVNAVSPGVVETPMTEEFFDYLTESNINRIKSMHPLGIGKVDDITPLVLFLLSDQSRWITGQNIIADGGYSVQ